MKHVVLLLQLVKQNNIENFGQLSEKITETAETNVIIKLRFVLKDIIEFANGFRAEIKKLIEQNISFSDQLFELYCSFDIQLKGEFIRSCQT